MLSNWIRLTLLLLFLSLGQVRSQQLPSKTYTTADGLPNNAIRALHLDSRGILWIGTENGISKLENGAFENFFESDGLAFNSCWAIAEDKNHHLWFGSYGGGVTFFDGRSFQKIQTQDGLADDRIRHFYPYEDYMLVGTEDGVSLIDIASLEVTTIAESTNDTDLNYTAGFWEAEDRLFYSTYRSGSYEILWNGKESQIQKINDWLPIFAVFQEGDQILLSDKGSLKSISQTDFTQGKTPHQSISSSVFWQKLKGLKNETYLLAAGLFTKDGGIYQWEKNELISLNERFSIDSRFIQAGVLDSEKGLLYLGTQDKGIYQVRVDENLIYERFGNKEVKAIEGKKGLLGLLHSQGLEIRDSVHSEVFQVGQKAFKAMQANYYRQNPEKIPDQMDGFFELDPTIQAGDLEFYELHYRDSYFWVNSNLGIFKLTERGEIETYLPVHCFSMGFTPDGKLLETNPYAGVRIYDDPNNFFYTYFHPDDPSTPLQIAKVESGKKRSYLASVFHGFYQWDGERFQSYLNEGIWEEQKFKSLHELENGNLLVGTEFGELFEISPHPDFDIINHWGNDDLQGTSILSIESYGDAIIVVTERGIHVLEEDRNSFFDEEQGFFQKVFLSTKRIGDQLYIGTSQGFYQVNLPGFIISRDQDIELCITEVKVNHGALSSEYFDWFVFQPQKLLLESDQNTLFIRFKPKGNLDSEKLRFRYRLKPTADWTEYFQDPVIELPYLPWGDYQLEVEVWNYQVGKMSSIKLLDFTIDRPLYQKDWFILLLVLLLLGLFLFVYWVRKRQFEAKTRLKQRLAEIKLEALRSQMNPHFTFNAINSIQYFILKNDSEQALNYLGKFSSLIRCTLEQSSKTEISLAEEVDYLSRYIEVENMRMDERVNWEIINLAQAESEQIKLSPMLIQPLVENVFVHAFTPEHPNPKLTVLFEITAPNQLLCTVEDNGVGFSNQQNPQHESKGTLLIREKLMLLPGYTEESLVVKTGKWGTKVSIRIYVYQ
ncbi:hypothetical protein SAMN04488104_102443 [Algoriphagus faecimaris]|uniref:Signal transduction histidine kinase internal region domain-containing protein n=1 Tax=Algoriphagus faecimaris TaxID=686796 RepID=A0A1G6TUX3_9BACT|nr:histidine kinase [Algoriphagus faecimaris]SDD32841.1 hypothetical protein SAMN04488104_102443 [Algoriphagus faecimaris]